MLEAVRKHGSSGATVAAKTHATFLQKVASAESRPVIGRRSRFVIVIFKNQLEQLDRMHGGRGEGAGSL